MDSEPVVGFHPVREALRAARRRMVRLHVREGLRRPELAELRKLAREAGVPVVEASAEVLNRLDTLQLGTVIRPEVFQLELEGNWK